MSKVKICDKYPLTMTVGDIRKSFQNDFKDEGSLEHIRNNNGMFDVIMALVLGYDPKSPDDNSKFYEKTAWPPKENGVTNWGSWCQNIVNNTGAEGQRDTSNASAMLSKFVGIEDTTSLQELCDIICRTYRTEYKNNIKKINYIQKFFGVTSSGTAMSSALEVKKEQDMNIQEQIKGLIENGQLQIILTGAPGTGKTYLAKKIPEEMGAQHQLVQFHPSYDYTDFVEGLRPIEVNGQVTFKKMDGIFKKFCREVVEANSNASNPLQNAENTENAENKKPLYFFIIDEINRADLSKVLGELMYCLEKDKRGECNRIQTQYANLPTYDKDGKRLVSDCFEDGFYIPENVVIIGTMNDIDRSVESFDFALRRRFTWKEVKVDEALLKSALPHIVHSNKVQDQLVIDLIDRILELNNTINTEGGEFGLNSHYHISQGHFTNLPAETMQNAKTICQYVWDYRIRNILEEYVRGEDQNQVEKFLEACRQSFCEEKPIGESNALQVSSGL